MNNQELEFNFNKDNLYREESVTDLKVGAIRCLIPIKLDGSKDEARKTLYMGHTQLMSQSGMIPIQAQLEADSLEKAISVFPQAMKKALAKMVEEAKKMQAEQDRGPKTDDSRIIMPGR